jgi:hypothetical protein
MNKLVLVCSAAVGLSLSFLFALFAGMLLGRLTHSTVTVVELVVVAVEFIQVAALVGHYRTRPPKIEILLRVFSLEILVMIFIFVAYALTASLFWADLVNTVFSTWVAGISLTLLPYLIFVVVVQMMRSRDPVQLLLLPALVFAVLAILSSSLVVFGNAISFASFLSFISQYTNIYLSAGIIPGSYTLYLLVPSVVMFCSLVVRITVPTPTSATPPRVSFVLPLLGAAVGLGWVSAWGRAVPDTLLTFTLPAVIIVVVLYAYLRR